MCDADAELNLLTAVFEQSAPPCEAQACEFRARCAGQPIACSSFAHYVRTGAADRPIRLPSRRIYDVIHGAGHGQA